jgi:flagellar motility protein MotE (MotC chaperone)
VAAVAVLPPNAMTAGAAMFLNAQAFAVPAMAQSSAAQAQSGLGSAIPLPPGEEDLRRPQKSPTPPPKPQPAGPPLPPPPPAASQKAAEEQSKRTFELNRRENQLNAREQAIKELEADLNVRLAAAEKAKAEMNELIKRNEAVLEEQKAATDRQKTEEDALKEARVEQLVLAFKGMKPEQAGQLINSMDDQVAVNILSAMPGGNAGKILAMVQPDKAARLVKALSERRIDPKAILERQAQAAREAAQSQSQSQAPTTAQAAPPGS